MSETRFGSVKGYSSMLHSLRKKAQALGADAILRPTKRIEKFRAYWPIIGLHQTTEFRLEAEAIIFVSQAERDALLKKGLVVAGLAVSNPMGVLFPTLKRESSKRRRARAKRDARKRRRARCKRSGKCRRKARRKSREKTLLDLIARR
jgi:hypothetical protein